MRFAGSMNRRACFARSRLQTPEARQARSAFPVRASHPMRPALIVAVLLMLLCASLVAPSAAEAYFNQVDDKNSAQQDIGSYGDPIPAEDIPDGEYLVNARTTSRMCVFYSTAEDAATRSDQKEQCVISVNDGKIIATFFMTSAYTHLFMGSAQQAAALTDATGTDDAAYVKGMPCYVEKSGESSPSPSAFRYSMELSALNNPVSFAAFNGGSSGVEGGKWFDRRVVIAPTSELLSAIGGANSGDTGTVGSTREPPTAVGDQPDGRPDGSEQPVSAATSGTDEGTSAETGAGVSGGSMASTNMSGESGVGSDSRTGADSSSEAASGKSALASSGARQSEGASVEFDDEQPIKYARASSTTAHADADAMESSLSATDSSPAMAADLKRRAVEVTPVSPAAPARQGAPALVALESSSQDSGALLFGIALVALFAFGIAIRTIAFALGKRG